METKETPTISYEKPSVVDYGDLVQLTAGTSSGDFLDADFANGTAKSQLTFSSQ